MVRGRHLLAAQETALHPRPRGCSELPRLESRSLAAGLLIGGAEAGSCCLHEVEKPVVLPPEFAILGSHALPGVLSLMSRRVPWSRFPSGGPFAPACRGSAG